MEGLIVFLGLLLIGYVVGTQTEKSHVRDIEQREQKVRHVPVYNLSNCELVPPAQTSTMVVGSVVISSDYFKTVMASLLSLIGGRISVYEGLLERGRREALLRMKEEAIAWGASQVLNVRIESASLNGDASNGLMAIEVMAYGTGIR